MGFIRNPEIKKNIIIWLVLSILAVITSFIIDIKCGITAGVLCIFFNFAHWIFTYNRYTKIAQLSNEIDKILYDSSSFDLSRFCEGELGILQSEIYKMTSMLREQADALIKDKKYLSDSIADISHQIRTPLTSINFIVDFLDDDSLDKERREKLIQELYTLLGRIDWLINTLLKISKFDAGTAHFEEKDYTAKELITRAVTPVSIPIELKGQTLKLYIDDNAVFHGDIAWTTEAIENIIKNCMEHTPENGTLTITVKENPVFLGITIEDTGNGIDGNDLSHIFERFYKGKDSADSSVGIGLALARMIISQQNGTIKAHNKDGVGAVFEIRFYKNTV